jgi:hypothetical protein
MKGRVLSRALFTIARYSLTRSPVKSRAFILVGQRMLPMGRSAIRRLGVRPSNSNDRYGISADRWDRKRGSRSNRARKSEGASAARPVSEAWLTAIPARRTPAATEAVSTSNAREDLREPPDRKSTKPQRKPPTV